MDSPVLPVNAPITAADRKMLSLVNDRRFLPRLLNKFYKHLKNYYATASTKNVKIISYNGVFVLA
jgi:hypothetical protein